MTDLEIADFASLGVVRRAEHMLDVRLRAPGRFPVPTAPRIITPVRRPRHGIASHDGCSIGVRQILGAATILGGLFVTRLAPAASAAAAVTES